MSVQDETEYFILLAESLLVDIFITFAEQDILK